MEVIITGAGGRIGKAFVEYLRKNTDYSLVLNYRCHESVPQEIQTDTRCRLVIGNLDETEIVSSLFASEASAIVHLGTGILRSSSVSPWTAAMLEQGKSTVALIEFLKDYPKPCHIIFPSSGGTVYQGTKDTRFMETDKLCACSPYGAHKIFMEECLRLLVSYNSHISCNVLRISNPYGMVAKREKKQGLVDILIYNFIHGHTTDIFVNIETTRDYIYIEDLNSALCKSLDYRNGFEVFNIGSGCGTSIKNIISAIEYISKKKPLIAYKQTHDKFYPEYSVLDITKANELLRWSPQYSFVNTIKLLLKGWM